MTTNNDLPEVGGDKLNRFKRPATPMKRTIHRVEYNGGEYVLEDIIEKMNEGHKMSAALTILYPTLPKAANPAVQRLIKKHPYFVAYKDVSLSLINNKGAALQQNALDLAFNARSEMVRADMTKDLMNRVYGKAEEENEANKPTMVFNFSFNQGQQPPKVTTEIIEGETA